MSVASTFWKMAVVHFFQVTADDKIISDGIEFAGQLGMSLP